MKVLLINCVYKQGSTGKIVESLHKGLMEEGVSSYVFYGTGYTSDEANIQRVCGPMEHNVNALLSRITGIPFGGFFISNRRIESYIQKEKPDVVHLHCINGSMVNVYKLLTFLGENNIRTVVTLHAEFFHTGSCSHAFECQKWKTGCFKCEKYKVFLPSYFFDNSSLAWSKMETSFSAFKKENLILTSVSPWLLRRAELSGILGSFDNIYVPNGVDTNIYYRNNVRQKTRPCALFVTPHFIPDNINDQKGGTFILNIAKLCPDIDFKIVASTSTFDKSRLPKNIQFIGRISDPRQLSEYYSNADVTLLLSKRETFSMVTAESLCCGTPVVGFRAGGPESIALRDFSSFVEYGDLEKLINQLRRFIDRTLDHLLVESSAAKCYSFRNVTNSYIEVYKKITHE